MAVNSTTVKLKKKVQYIIKHAFLVLLFYHIISKSEDLKMLLHKLLNNNRKIGNKTITNTYSEQSVVRSIPHSLYFVLSLTRSQKETKLNKNSNESSNNEK